MIDVDIEQQLGSFHLDVRFAAEAPIVGLFGRSGSGKTSVINAIAGIARPRRGSIRINEAVLFDDAKHVDVPPERTARRLRVPGCACCFRIWMSSRTCSMASGSARSEDRFIDEARIIELLGLSAPAAAQAQGTVGRRKAARRHRPRVARAAAHPAHGRAAGLARRSAQDGDSRLRRTAARRAAHSRSSMSATRSPRSRVSPTPWWCLPTANASRAARSTM